MEGPELRLLVGQLELGLISVALDAFCDRYKDNPEHGLREVRDKWDKLYRAYHSQRGKMSSLFVDLEREFNDTPPVKDTRRAAW